MNDYFAEIGFWPKGSGIRSYLLGLILSLAATLGAYLLVVRSALPYEWLVAGIVALALLQFIVQATCFLHLAGKGASKERLAIFAAALVVVIILVSGSLWIMTTLAGRMMPTTEQMEQYMQDQGGF